MYAYILYTKAEILIDWLRRRVVQKYWLKNLTQNIDESNLFDIFCRVVNILTTLQYFDACVGSCHHFDPKIQSSGEHLAKTRARATAASGSKISTQWILIKVLMERVWTICCQKSYQKLDVHFLIQNIDCFFLIVYGALKAEFLIDWLLEAWRRLVHKSHVCKLWYTEKKIESYWPNKLSHWRN